MRILVAGAAGFIGSRVVALLTQRGYDVSCLVRATTNADRLEGLNWERVTGDLRDPIAVDHAVRSCDAVIQLASPASWDAIDSPELRDTNVAGTQSVLASAARTGARVVFVSSIAAVACSDEPRMFDETATFTADPREMPYAAAKQEAEAACLEAVAAGGDVVIVNPGEVYGPHDTRLTTASTLLDFARSWPVLVCTGGTAIVHVDDVADGIVRALERGRTGERYILAGENVTVRQLAELTLTCLERLAPMVSVPNSLIRGLARFGTWSGVPLPFNPKIVPYATRYWFMSAGKARAELDVTFRSARATLQPTIHWLCEAGHI